jgi:HSP20 family protein
MRNQRTDPFQDLMSLREAMSHLFEQSVVSPQNWGNGQRTGRALPIDLYSTDDAYVLQANVAGVDPNDVDITIEGNTLTIRGERQPPTNAGGYLLQERRFGPFERTLELDLPIQADKVEATFNNGVLTLTLPKMEKAKPKVIKVKPTQ